MWPFRTKQSEAPVEQKLAGGSSTMFFGVGAGSFMQQNAEAYAKEGYAQNVVAFACIHKIASSVASVALQLQRGDSGDTVDKHPLLDLLARPNPSQSGSDFFYAMAAWRLIAGEAFICRGGQAGTGKATAPRQLLILEPQKVKINAGPFFGIPASFDYEPTGGKKITFPVDQVTGKSDVLHLRNFNPLAGSRGLSPLSAAAYSIDTHSAMLRHNKALLDNGGRPSGALTVTNSDGTPMTLTAEQRSSLKQSIAESYSGVTNTGRPLVLEGGMEWKEMGLSPKDLDFNTGMWAQAINICMALGTPSQLLGIPGSQTHANFEQAVETFWEDTVLPLIDSILDACNYWLVPMYGESDLKFFVDRDSISALESQRQILYDRAQKSDFKTITEKRAMVGDPPLTEDQKPDLLVSNTMIPLDMLSATMDEAEPAPLEDTVSPGAADTLPEPKPKKPVAADADPKA